MSMSTQLIGLARTILENNRPRADKGASTHEIIETKGALLLPNGNTQAVSPEFGLNFQLRGFFRESAAQTESTKHKHGYHIQVFQ